MGWSEAIAELDRLREAGREMGGPEAIERLHARGKLTPRERIERLVDAGTFHEIGGLVEGFVAVRGREPRLAPCDALVAGWANVDDRRVFIVADDGSIASGSRGPGGAVKAAFISGLARKQGYPLVQLLEASAPRMQGMMGAQFAGAPGAGDRDGAFGRGWNRGGEIPRVQAAMGSSVGGPSFSAPSCEFILMTKRTGAWGVSGPPVVLGGLQQEVDMQEIGGSAVHADSTGFADYPAEDDDDGLRVIREWLSYFPSNSRQLPPRVDRGDPPDRRSPQLTEIVPVDHRRPYDMHRVIEAIVDDGRFLEMKHSFGKTVITCYARLNGHSVGIVAKQPRFLGGIMDSKGGVKIVRFVQVCDAYNIPLIFLQDQPGFIVGPKSERENAPKMVSTLSGTMARLHVPILTVWIRKAYGYSAQLLGGKRYADYVVAWPTASVSLAGPEVGVNTIMQSEVRSGTMSQERREELYRYYRRVSRASNAAHDYRIDDMVDDPADTRRYLCDALEMALWRRQHGMNRTREIDPV